MVKSIEMLTVLFDKKLREHFSICSIPIPTPATRSRVPTHAYKQTAHLIRLSDKVVFTEKEKVSLLILGKKYSILLDVFDSKSNYNSLA